MQGPALLAGALSGLFRHDVPHHGGRFDLFVDAFSQFGIAFEPLGALGPALLAPRATLSTYELARPLLELALVEDGVEIPVQRQCLDSDPWLVRESARVPLVRGTLGIAVEHVFVDARTLRTRFRFANHAEEAVRIDPCWRGSVRTDDTRYMVPYFHGTADLPRVARLEAGDCTVVGRMDSPGRQDGLPGAAFRIRALAPHTRASTDGLRYRITCAAPVDLAAGEEYLAEFLVDVDLWKPGTAGPRWSAGGNISSAMEECVAAAQSRFADAIALHRPPAVESPALALRCWRARQALLRNGIAGLGGEFGESVACLCTADNTDFSCVFFWDTLFSSAAIARFNPAYARGAIRTAFVRTDERDGSTPERKFNHSALGRMAQQSPQSPVAAWAVRNYVAATGDNAFAEELYPQLVSLHRFWKEYSDTDRDGLAEYRWTGQVSDNSPLWDPYAALDQRTGCGWVPPIASVALNSFLVWDAKHLACLADSLGRRDEAVGHRQRASQLERDLTAVCFCADEGRFWDYNHHTRQHRRVRTWQMFWPVFAGVAMPGAVRDALLDDVLLDPAQFFGEVPFPSVALDEPAHDPLGYWRGRAWPHIVFWLLETLVREGRAAAADEAARRFLRAMGRAPGFPENLPSDASLAHRAGFADYNWGCAAFLMVAAGEYRKPLPLA